MIIDRSRPEHLNATLGAVVRAVGPPDSLTDEVVLGTVDDVMATFEALGPMARGALLLSARVVENSSRLRRYGGAAFSRLSADSAGHALDALSSGIAGPFISLLRGIVVFNLHEQPALRSRVGYEPDSWIHAVARTRQERWGDQIDAHRRLIVAPAPLVDNARSDTATARPPATAAAAHALRPHGGIRHGRDIPPSGIECDVVVVGSGAGGATAAAELAEAGLSVVVVEEGDHHPTETFTTNTGEMLRRLYRESGASTTLGVPPVQFSEGRCVGGSTVVNGGMAFRASERVLDGWASRSGTGDLTATALDPYYRRVERFLSVGPQDPGSVGADQRLLVQGAERLGWKTVENTRAQVHCAGCNVCTWGCPTGAKQSTLVSYLPRAVSFGATVFSNCRVDRVMFRGKRAVGVEGIVEEDAAGCGRPFRVHARRVVVSAGAIQTPGLLLRSGVTPPSGQLGRNLVLHPGAAVTAVFDEPVLGWKGAHQTHQVREFEREGIVMAAVNLPPSLVARSLPLRGTELGELMDGYNRMVTAGVLVEDRGSGRVRAMGRRSTVATYQLSESDCDRLVRATLLLCEGMLAAGAAAVYLPFAGSAPVRSHADLAQARALPVRRHAIETSTVHLMGTARLGHDPVQDVCDPNGAVHGTAGLSVADASLFPGPVGTNPMLTIMALATRVAEGIIESWPTP